uniref:Bifunctional lysine-specific demethylase and histidyl-hydroxylase n=1 Tax=Odontella aurita TaxID=265563 RepID=A0A7S4I6Q8_9STRA|mmetsp:Transcript_20746/g.60348  ORF Transcript_20746/g.60348 Transcript_20746/m.60348 type:complete len:454 (+) Transcript_20746:1200-2561(+)
MPSLFDSILFLADKIITTSRTISHVPGDDCSWTLELGPFDRDRDDSIRFMFDDRLSSLPMPFKIADGGVDDDGSSQRKRRRKIKSTVIVNDVDRFHPPLSDWLASTFSFAPRWRLDDAQISLSENGGGIGPHVDDYDVVLVQAAGTRTWEVGRRFLGREEEFDRLEEGLDVRILRGWGEDEEAGGVERFELSPGDALYLPPRVIHKGTATSDGCITLSVGFRSPSALDLVSRAAEIMGNDDRALDKATKRYVDPDLMDGLHTLGGSSSSAATDNEITPDAKERAKALVLDAVSELLDNTDSWDEFVGRAFTESKRVRMGYPLALDELDDESRAELGDWGDPSGAVRAVLDKRRGVLRHAEGVAFGHSTVEEGPGGGESLGRWRCRIFADGEMWEVRSENCGNVDREEASAYLAAIANNPMITGECFGGKAVPSEVKSILEDLVSRGYLYGYDE